jgi:hypothetical protein
VQLRSLRGSARRRDATGWGGHRTRPVRVGVQLRRRTPPLEDIEPPDREPVAPSERGYNEIGLRPDSVLEVACECCYDGHGGSHCTAWVRTTFQAVCDNTETKLCKSCHRRPRGPDTGAGSGRRAPCRCNCEVCRGRRDEEGTGPSSEADARSDQPGLESDSEDEPPPLVDDEPLDQEDVEPLEARGHSDLVRHTELLQLGASGGATRRTARAAPPGVSSQAIRLSGRWPSDRFGRYGWDPAKNTDAHARSGAAYYGDDAAASQFGAETRTDLDDTVGDESSSSGTCPDVMTVS